MKEGYSLIVETQKDNYAVIKVSEDIFNKSKKLSSEASFDELEKMLEESVLTDNIIATEMSAFQAASIAQGISNDFYIIKSK